MEEKVRPGINPRVILNHFTDVEQKIIKNLSSEWYVINGGGIISSGPTSKYGYFLVKPTDTYREMFNLRKELIVLFSPYETFEPRTLDAFDYIFNRYQKLRLEKICSIVISKDYLLYHAYGFEKKYALILCTDTSIKITLRYRKTNF